MYIDTHAHLNFNEFKNDYPEVIRRAQENGVEKIIIPSSDPQNSRRAVEIAQEFEGVYPTVGAHPLHIKSGFSLMVNDGLAPALLMDSYNSAHARRCSLNYFKEMVEFPGVVAIGEIGLDYQGEKGSRSIDRDVQQAALTAIIKATIRTKKPYILHCRPTQDSNDGLEDLYRILTNLFAKSREKRGVVHCFAGDYQWAKRFFNLGFLISYTGLITFTDRYDQDIAKIPLNRLLLETDAPFLAPEPHRGERCEPAYVIEVAKKIAKIKKISLIDVAKQTTENAEKLFQI